MTLLDDQVEKKEDESDQTDKSQEHDAEVSIEGSLFHLNILTAFCHQDNWGVKIIFSVIVFLS
jgi:hypothetical protein